MAFLCVRICLCPFIKVTHPGAAPAPGPPAKTGALVRRFRGCKSTQGSVREQATRNFPVLGVPQHWPISDVGDYSRLIGQLSVISIGHTRELFPTATGFLVSGFCFRVFAATSTQSSRPAPTHQSPATADARSKPLPSPRAAAHASALSTTPFTSLHRPFPTTRRIPPRSCRPPRSFTSRAANLGFFTARASSPCGAFGLSLSGARRALASQLAAARCSSRDPRREDSPRMTEKKTQAGYPCTNVRKGSTLTFDGHTPAVTKEGRGRGCLVSHCKPFVVVVLRPIESSAK